MTNPTPHPSSPSPDERPPAPPQRRYTRASFTAEQTAREPLDPALNAPLPADLTARYPELYLLGIRHFNHFAMFECHEILEAVWNDAVDEERRFVQGVIQIAVAILHWESKHKPGVLSVFRTGRALLQTFSAGRFMGVDLPTWLPRIDALFAPILAAKSEALPLLDYRQIPMITVDGVEP